MAVISVGAWVRHPKCPDWGVGQVLGEDRDTLRILFSEVGEKTVNVRFVALENSEAPADARDARPKLRARSDIAITKLERLCHTFHDQLKDRRSTTDDGRMALEF
jgi:Protein of unknown function (DUF3553)